MSIRSTVAKTTLLLAVVPIVLLAHPLAGYGPANGNENGGEKMQEDATILGAAAMGDLELTEVYRIDAPFALDRSKFQAELVPLKPLTSSTEGGLISSLTAAKVSTDGFEVRFTCKAESDRNCEKAKKGFELAAKMIASVLAINTPIIIQAVYRSFCTPATSDNTDSQGLCTERDTLGQAGPASYWYGTYAANERLRERQLLYPQALVKQFQRDSAPLWNDVDIIAEFNSDADFWFPGDPPIASNQHDFLYVIFHELVHGLGFLSGWRNHFQAIFTASSSSTLTSFLVPPPIFTSSGGKPTQVLFRGWESLFVFDAFIRAGGKETITLADDIERFSPAITEENKDINTYVPAFLKSEAIRSARTMYKYSTTSSPGLQFWSKFNKPVSLATPSKFVSASSISHVASAAYSKTADFLMRSHLENGTTLESLMAKYPDSQAGIGPETKKILQSLGWALTGESYSKWTFGDMGNRRRVGSDSSAPKDNTINLWTIGLGAVIATFWLY